jgi:hypothetical protein
MPRYDSFEQVELPVGSNHFPFACPTDIVGLITNRTSSQSSDLLTRVSTIYIHAGKIHATIDRAAIHTGWNARSQLGLNHAIGCMKGGISTFARIDYALKANVAE